VPVQNVDADIPLVTPNPSRRGSWRAPSRGRPSRRSGPWTIPTWGTTPAPHYFMRV